MVAEMMLVVLHLLVVVVVVVVVVVAVHLEVVGVLLLHFCVFFFALLDGRRVFALSASLLHFFSLVRVALLCRLQYPSSLLNFSVL